MKAAIYARYSSENQRSESITDQIYSCRRYATDHGWTVDDTLIFSDEAVSGAREDRAGLHEMMEAARSARFDALLVDDLSRLARNNLLMLTVIGDLHFLGIRLVSVADGLDSNQEEANFSIQLRGIANELFLTDLRKKVLRGQPRPDGFKMEAIPSEANIVNEIFTRFASVNRYSQLSMISIVERCQGVSEKQRNGAFPQSAGCCEMKSMLVDGSGIGQNTERIRGPAKLVSFPKIPRNGV